MLATTTLDVEPGRSADRLQTQELATHACPDAQAIPQPPQLAGSFVTLISQPSTCLLLLQSAKPATHAPLHRPPLQLGLTMWLFEQTAPQAPQLATLVVTLTSQPSSCLLPLQSANPATHEPVHEPPVQPGLATWFAEQTTPQAPQFATLVATLISQPLELERSQSAKPALQDAILQAPFWQLGALLGKLHAVPQPPQFATSVLRSTQFAPQFGVTSPVQALHAVPCALQIRVPVWQRPVPGVPAAAV